MYREWAASTKLASSFEISRTIMGMCMPAHVCVKDLRTQCDSELECVFEFDTDIVIEFH
jgi:hypothetical protein